MKMCGKCFGVYYCSRECQKNHYDEHSKTCEKVSADLARSVKADIKLEQAVNSLFYYLLFDPSVESTAEPYSELISNTPLGKFMYTMQAHGDMFLLTRDNEGYLGVTIYRRNEVLSRLRNIVKECLERKRTLNTQKRHRWPSTKPAKCTQLFERFQRSALLLDTAKAAVKCTSSCRMETHSQALSRL